MAYRTYGHISLVLGTLAVSACSAPVALGSADIGGNIEANKDWATSGMWMDVAKTFRTWGDPDQPWNSNLGLQLSADGYPLQPAGALSYLYDYPAGTYKLSYRGTGDVTFSWMGAARNVQRVGDMTTADVDVRHSDSMLLMKVTNVDPQNPIHDLHLLVPGAASGRVFTDQFLRRLAPLSTIRFMDLLQTNANPVQSWSQRTTASNFIQTSKSGIAIEYALAMANESGKNPWLNIPAQADDDYVRNMAKLIHQSLAPNRTAYIEYSNELWNTVFAQYGQVLAMAKADPNVTAADDLGKVAQEAAIRTKRFGDIFKQEFGADTARVKIILGGQAAGTRHATTALTYLQSRYGDVRNCIDGLAIAPYVGFGGSQDVAGLTVDTIISAMNQTLETTVTSWIRNSSALAKQYGLPLMAYEGGQALNPWNTNTRDYTNQDVKRQAEHDPRMGKLYERLVQVWQENGGGLYNMYNLISADSNFGYWGLLEHATDSGSPKWDAILRLTQPVGDATLDGAVDTADMQVLMSHFGQSGMWWEQGDFTGDGRVNADDLVLLDRALHNRQLVAIGFDGIVPEPAAYAVLWMGAVSLVLRRRRDRSINTGDIALLGRPSTVESQAPCNYKKTCAY